MCLSVNKTITDLRTLARALEEASDIPSNDELTRIGHLVKRCFLHLVHVTHTAEPQYKLSLASKFIDWDALVHSLMYNDKEEVDDALYDPETRKHFEKEPEPERA